MQATTRVKGLREFLRAANRAEKDTKKEIRARFRRVGDIVRVESVQRFSPIDPRSAAGFRTRVRQRGVSVEQSRRRVTGKRGDYGALQMRRALVPALEDKKNQTEREFERAVDELANIMEG